MRKPERSVHSGLKRCSEYVLWKLHVMEPMIEELEGVWVDELLQLMMLF